MEVTELYNLTLWVDQENVTSDQPDNLLEKYSQFITALQNSQGGHVPFQNERESLEDALNEINFLSLTRDQKEFLDKINVLQSLGQPASENIENILTRSGLDVATATSKIQDMHNNLAQGLEKLKFIRDGLKDYIPDDHAEILSHEGVLTRLSFIEKTSINNVVDFKKSAADWYLIGRGLAEATDSKPEDIKIIGASRGSIIVDLLLFLPVAIALLKIISLILNSTKTYYEIQDISQSIKGKELDNELKTAILADLKKVEEGEKNKFVEATVEAIMKQLKFDQQKRSSIEGAVKKLSTFLERGGHIDFVFPPEDEGEEDEEAEDPKTQKALSRFRNDVQEARLLMDEVKQLRHMPSDTDVNEPSDDG